MHADRHISRNVEDAHVARTIHAALRSQCAQVGLATETDYVHVMSARLFACSRVGAPELRRDGTAARDLLTKYFPDAADAHAALVDVWATLEAKAGKADEARELCWAPLVRKKGGGGRRSAEKRYAWWEVQWGEIGKLREHYREVLGRKRGGPVEARREAAAAWVRAEERFGGVREEMEARRALHALAATGGGDGGDAGGGDVDGGKRKLGDTGDEGQEAKRVKTGVAGGDAKAAGGGSKATGGDGAAAGKADELRVYDDRFTVFVKHLHERVTEADLKSLFEVRAWLLL